MNTEFLKLGSNGSYQENKVYIEDHLQKVVVFGQVVVRHRVHTFDYLQYSNDTNWSELVKETMTRHMVEQLMSRIKFTQIRLPDGGAEIVARCMVQV